MRILVDTHVWLWWLSAPARLHPEAVTLLADAGNTLYLSAASVWEIVIKHGLGKLTLPSSPAVLVPQAIAEDGLVPLAIEHRHALAVTTLPPVHRDPFDRLIIAQAQVEGLPVLTADETFREYGVNVVPAV
jgi:PIN domain nuclease of toxin-antitoxin system